MRGLEIIAERAGGQSREKEQFPSAAGKERGRKTERGDCSCSVGGEGGEVGRRDNFEMDGGCLAPVGGEFFRKSVLNLCPECSQTCAGVIVTVVVLVTDFFPILGAEAQQNGAQARHSHHNDHEVTRDVN